MAGLWTVGEVEEEAEESAEAEKGLNNEGTDGASSEELLPVGVAYPGTPRRIVMRESIICGSWNWE